jgi:hypothetical protein
VFEYCYIQSMEQVEKMIEEAKQDAMSFHTVVRGDGTSFRTTKDEGWSNDSGRFAVNVVIAQQRTRHMRTHSPKNCETTSHPEPARLT